MNDFRVKTTLIVEVCDDGKINVAEDNGASGAIYDGVTAEDVGFAVETYCKDYVEGM